MLFFVNNLANKTTIYICISGCIVTYCYIVVHFLLAHTLILLIRAKLYLVYVLFLLDLDFDPHWNKDELYESLEMCSVYTRWFRLVSWTTIYSTLFEQRHFTSFPNFFLFIILIQYCTRPSDEIKYSENTNWECLVWQNSYFSTSCRASFKASKLTGGCS